MVEGLAAMRDCQAQGRDPASNDRGTDPRDGTQRRDRRRDVHRATPARQGAAMKPISTVPRALRTVDVHRQPATAINQRSDACAVSPLQA